ncbi:MAG: alpha-galactosidase [Ruminococcaceae bacterium]|nr:alpha-galactosidase [Oscillospiraceae bacterium]
MILHDNGLFLLKNDSFSYLFKVGKYGELQHLHFGAPVEITDADCFACIPGPGWGSNLVMDDADPHSCPDFIPLEWSGSGRGDYRESPLEIGRATDLRYVNHRILEGSQPMVCGLPQAHGDCETLEITLEQPGLRLKLYYSLFDTALVRRTVVENTGDGEISLHKCMSFSMDLPGNYIMTTFHGGWSAEMRRMDNRVGGAKITNESRTGASSNQHNPGFFLREAGTTENDGVAYGFNLVYSGNHYAAAQQSQTGLTRVMQGINPANFCKVLAPGEVFETPEAVLCWSDAGLNGLSRAMHKFVNDHIVPEYWAGRPRPVLYNSWEGCVFDFNQHRLLNLADRAKDLGCELFVLDDGWFGVRNNDHCSLGDYNVNLKKLPDGMDGLAKRITAKGMQFGLWFEPESVSPDSDLYRAHPDWALTDEFTPILGRHQLLLDLTKPEVRDYIVSSVTGILDTAAISYVKWDMNRHSVALGAKAHDYILGLYDILRRIFGPRPEILLESCSSGGNRFDLGMLCFSPQVWCSDDTDPIERLTIQGNLSYLYPQSTFGAHVSAAPHAQTLRATPLSTRGNVSFFGCLGYELDLKHLFPVEITEIKNQIAFYKQYRALFQYGRFTRHALGWQVSDSNMAISGVFHQQVSAAPPYERLRITGLEKEKTYRFRSLEQKIRVGQFGNLLKHVVPFSVSPSGLLVRTADAHYAMPDGGEDRTATGAALASGVMLKPLFRGTGYTTDQRNQGDYGSNVYIIEPVE